MVRAEGLGMPNQGCAVIAKLDVAQGFANLV